MHSVKRFAGLVLACIIFSGCAYLDSPRSKARKVTTAPIAMEVVSQGHTICERPGQEGCFELIAGNYRYDPTFPAMAGLGKVAVTADEAMRWTSFGNLFHRAHEEGRVFASTPRAYRIYMWHVHPVSVRNLSAFQYDGREVRRWEVADVTGTVGPTLWFNQDARLGPPQKVYRVVAFGNSPGHASLQIPWSMVTENTFILICQEDGLNFHPPRRSTTDSGGYWFTPKLLEWHRSQKRSTQVRFAFLTP